MLRQDEDFQAERLTPSMSKNHFDHNKPFLSVYPPLEDVYAPLLIDGGNNTFPNNYLHREQPDVLRPYYPAKEDIEEPHIYSVLTAITAREMEAVRAPLTKGINELHETRDEVLRCIDRHVKRGYELHVFILDALSALDDMCKSAAGDLGSAKAELERTKRVRDTKLNEAATRAELDLLDGEIKTAQKVVYGVEERLEQLVDMMAEVEAVAEKYSISQASIKSLRAAPSNERDTLAPAKTKAGTYKDKLKARYISDVESDVEELDSEEGVI